jgi:glycosyltransferase involved in cell wall biosynthesis
MTAPCAKITISICTYERYDVLPTAIESALNQSLAADMFRILVVDNSPDHERARAFGARFSDIPNLRYVVEQTPGLSNARNVSAQTSETEFISFMDDDAIAHPNWLEAILDAFDVFGPSATVVGGRVDPIWSAPRPSWIHDSLLGNLSVVNWGGFARIAGADEWFAGTNISFRRQAILDNGGFSTALGRVGSGASLMSNEEKALVTRISEGGGRLVYAPNASVDHLVEPERLTRTWFRKRAAWQAVSDFVMDPVRYSADCAGRWKETMRYFNELPPHERTIRGFVFDTEDSELFRRQLGAIYTMTVMNLAGFTGVVT